MVQKIQGDKCSSHGIEIYQVNAKEISQTNEKSTKYTYVI